jgi:hypothetical protein
MQGNRSGYLVTAKVEIITYLTKNKSDMKFTQPCVIRKNTFLLRVELLKLGYHLASEPITTITEEGEFELPNNGLHATRSGRAYVKNVNNMPPHIIDCGENEDLFIAIAALRSDNDYMQWFTNDVEMIRCTCHKWENEIYSKWHKASAKELVEYFQP